MSIRTSFFLRYSLNIYEMVELNHTKCLSRQGIEPTAQKAELLKAEIGPVK